ncbi:MAG: hypothetical protein WKG07_00150 [Hymenobacter sp.]
MHEPGSDSAHGHDDQASSLRRLAPPPELLGVPSLVRHDLRHVRRSPGLSAPPTLRYVGLPLGSVWTAERIGSRRTLLRQLNDRRPPKNRPTGL